MDHRHGLNRRPNRPDGFTLMEIIVVALLISLVSGVIYQLFSGTFSHFFKNQTKMNNLRAASIILEYLKSDVRRAILPVSATQAPIFPTAGNQKFSFFLQHNDAVRRVTYSYDGRMIRRSLEGAADRALSEARVASFSVDQGQSGTTKFLQITIVADEEMVHEKRTGTSLGNKVKMTAILYPRFFANFSNKEEEYWALARKS